MTPQILQIFRALVFTCLLLLSLSACGKKGGLYLPDPQEDKSSYLAPSNYIGNYISSYIDNHIAHINKQA